MSQFQRIQNALVAAVNTATFRRVSFDANTRQALVTDIPSKVVGISANPNSTQFGRENVRNRMIDAVDKIDETWLVIVDFESGFQTDDEAFIDAVTKPVLKILASGSDRQVTLTLKSAKYSHPPFQSPSAGTQARYEFAAKQTPY